MHPLYFLTFLGIIGLNTACFGQQTQRLEERRQDSVAIQNRKFLSAATVNLKTQYPIQHAISLEVASPIFLSGHVSVGQFSRFYTKSALEFLPQEDEAQIKRKEFVQDKLQNGFVFEIGVKYHIVKWRNTYAGLNMQIQRFKLPTTTQEMVEEYDFGDTQGRLGDILTLVESSPALNNFYENAMLTPSITNFQLEFKLGKRFHFKKLSKLFLDLEVSYQFNLSAQVSIEAPSAIGNNLIENFVKPILNQGSEESFGGFALPTIGLRLSYQLGERIYRWN